MLAKPHSALLLVGHGSTVNPDSSAPTFAHADEIRRRGVFAEVGCAFWKEESSLRQALHTLKSDEVYVVPNFISEGYFTQTILPRELGIALPQSAQSSRSDLIQNLGELRDLGGSSVRTIKYCEPVGNHPRMTELLLHRAAEVAPGIAPRDTSLLIIGHGTSLHENSGAAVEEQVRRIAARGGYAEVFGAFLEQEPFVAHWRKLVTQPNVVAVPFFISDGLHSYQEIPVLLGLEAAPTQAASKMEVFRRNPYHVDGHAVYYASAIGTEPLFADLILDQVARFDER